jgi:hypothetical protein
MLPRLKMIVSPEFIVMSVGENEKPELFIVTVAEEAIPAKSIKIAESI